MASILTWLSYLPSLARGWASLTQVACPAPLLLAASPHPPTPASMTGPTRQGVLVEPWVTGLGNGACSMMRGLSQGPVPPGADVSIRNWGPGGCPGSVSAQRSVATHTPSWELPLRGGRAASKSFDLLCVGVRCVLGDWPGQVCSHLLGFWADTTVN